MLYYAYTYVYYACGSYYYYSLEAIYKAVYILQRLGRYAVAAVGDATYADVC